MSFECVRRGRRCCGSGVLNLNPSLCDGVYRTFTNKSLWTGTPPTSPPGGCPIRGRFVHAARMTTLPQVDMAFRRFLFFWWGWGGLRLRQRVFMASRMSGASSWRVAHRVWGWRVGRGDLQLLATDHQEEQKHSRNPLVSTSGAKNRR